METTKVKMELIDETKMEIINRIEPHLRGDFLRKLIEGITNEMKLEADEAINRFENMKRNIENLPKI